MVTKWEHRNWVVAKLKEIDWKKLAGQEWKELLGFQMQHFSCMTEVSSLQAEIKPIALHVVWIWPYKKAIQENCRGRGFDTSHGTEIPHAVQHSCDE